MDSTTLFQLTTIRQALEEGAISKAVKAAKWVGHHTLDLPGKALDLAAWTKDKADVAGVVAKGAVRQGPFDMLGNAAAAYMHHKRGEGEVSEGAVQDSVGGYANVMHAARRGLLKGFAGSTVGDAAERVSTFALDKAQNKILSAGGVQVKDASTAEKEHPWVARAGRLAGRAVGEFVPQAKAISKASRQIDTGVGMVKKVASFGTKEEGKIGDAVRGAVGSVGNAVGAVNHGIVKGFDGTATADNVGGAADEIRTRAMHALGAKARSTKSAVAGNAKLHSLAVGAGLALKAAAPKDIAADALTALRGIGAAHQAANAIKLGDGAAAVQHATSAVGGAKKLLKGSATEERQLATVRELRTRLEQLSTVKRSR